MSDKRRRAPWVWAVALLVIGGIAAVTLASNHRAEEERRSAEAACREEIESRYARNPELARHHVFATRKGRVGEAHDIQVVDSGATFVWTCRATRGGTDWTLDIWK